MMRLFPNGFGGFDLVEEDGLLGLGGLVGGFFKVICLLFAVAIPPFILGNLPGDLRTLWEADWLDWPAPVSYTHLSAAHSGAGQPLRR